MTRKAVAGIAAVLIASAAGVGLIKQAEGYRSRVYLDDAGIPTVCYGHTGPDVRMGQLARTQEECDKLLKQDIDKHSAAINRCIKRPLTQNQYDAVLSLAFNIGDGALCRSTLARKLNAGDLKGAAEEFPRWNKVTVDGKIVVSAGLSARREREKQLFEGKVPE